MQSLEQRIIDIALPQVLALQSVSYGLCNIGVWQRGEERRTEDRDLQACYNSLEWTPTDRPMKTGPSIL